MSRAAYLANIFPNSVWASRPCRVIPSRNVCSIAGKTVIKYARKLIWEMRQKYNQFGSSQAQTNTRIHFATDIPIQDV